MLKTELCPSKSIILNSSIFGNKDIREKVNLNQVAKTGLMLFVIALPFVIGLIFVSSHNSDAEIHTLCVILGDTAFGR